MLAWISLFLASLFEIIWAMSLKQSHGFTKLWPSVMSILAMGPSIFFLSYAFKHLPASLAYPIWVAIGVIGISLIGIIWLNENAHPLKFVCIALIVVGIIGLQFTKDAP